jgi:hypothetical protein
MIAIKLLRNIINTLSVTIGLGHLKRWQFVSITGCKRYANIKEIKNGASVSDTM